MRAAALLLLLVVTATVYAGVRGHDFIIVDDPAYVFLNPWVMEGLTTPGVLWAFTSFDAFNWHPLTWVSHMVDVEFLGPEPEPQHLMNVAFHVLNTAFLFFAFRRLTGRDWESLGIAALFALHPLHVESVAWISERKDVLSACFSFLALWAYGAYAARPGVLRYLLVAVLLAAGLLAKPMVVTLPLVLLLLDVWPLERAGWSEVRRLAVLFLEKVPLLGLALVASVLTMAAQQPGVEHSAETLPWLARLGNSIVSYERYLELTVWPVGLSAFYPHPGWLPVWRVAVAAVVLGAFSWLCLRERLRRPYLLVGWLWFLGTLVPVIGFVQVGDQGMADRYMYVPQVGLFLMLVFGLSDLTREGRLPRTVVVTVSAIVLAVLALLTRERVAAWESTETLYEGALAVTEGNSFAHFSLATVFLIEERREEARNHLEQAVAIHPDHAEALNELGNLALQDGDPEGALALYLRAVTSGAWLFEAQINMAILLDHRGRLAEALPYYRAAAKLEPYHPGVQLRLGSAYERRLAPRRAAAHYRRALQLDPELADARDGLARVRARIPRRSKKRGSGPQSSAGSM